MVGTLWESESGVCVCTKYEDGFYTLMYLDAPDCFSVAQESNIHFYYKQLTQPQEDT